MDCVAPYPQITGGTARILSTPLGYCQCVFVVLLSWCCPALSLISTKLTGKLVGVNADECSCWLSRIYFEWSNSTLPIIKLASSKINSRLDRLLPDYLRDTVEWITK
ncbi:hypothetical protein LOAG_05296 [Loa loa]|uniref:Uncharacterized protein n=1 Tax=Loa loa TaxID=7209 RepID=A0A1S0U077_LOALO|nr:hypothetical protein LOAG_05296 [Loa loa]EFO23194.2 hypothetical protein LOAG_05296 [Loa loa]